MTAALSLIELFIYTGLLEFVKLIFPIYLSLFYLIYPLFYLYTKRLVFTGNELKKECKLLFYLLPIVVFVLFVLLYFPLPPEDKLKLIHWQFGSLEAGDLFTTLTTISITLYYLQFFVYLFLFIKLYKSAKENMSDRIIDKNIVVTWLKYFIVLVIIYEFSVAGVMYFFPIIEYESVIQLLSLILLLLLGILRINQSTIEIQTRLRKAKFNLEEVKETNTYYILGPEEKIELMNLIKEAFKERKFFTDANLTIDKFSKKIHVSARKLSVVINEITGENFSQLLNKYRIEEAKKLLISAKDDLSIENIYLRTGFNSRSTFNRVFKSITGLTPKEYKSAHLLN